MRSLSDFLTASQLLTLTTRKSDLQKVSKSTFSSELGLELDGGKGGLPGLFLELSSSASSFVMSMRGKSVSPFVTLTFSGRLPQWAALSQQRTGSVRAYLGEGPLAAFGHEGREQAGADAQASEQVIHDGGQPRAL